MTKKNVCSNIAQKTACGREQVKLEQAGETIKSEIKRFHVSIASCKVSNSFHSPIILTHENENLESILQTKSSLVILLLLAISVSCVARAVNAVSPVHVSVSLTPVVHGCFLDPLEL